LGYHRWGNSQKKNTASLLGQYLDIASQTLNYDIAYITFAFYVLLENKNPISSLILYFIVIVIHIRLDVIIKSPAYTSEGLLEAENSIGNFEKKESSEGGLIKKASKFLRNNLLKLIYLYLILTEILNLNLSFINQLLIFMITTLILFNRIKKYRLVGHRI